MGEGSYFNFDLIVERVGEIYRARVLDSPAGQASTEFNIPFSELELENFVLRMGKPRVGVRRVDSSEMEAVKGCGERLFRAVFKDDVYAAFLRSRDNALEEGQGLRVRLRIDVPEFHDYPWEYLYNAHLNQFLALSRETPVVRYLELPYPVQPLTVKPPLKILVMISSPEGFPKLQVEEEWMRLSNALTPLIRRDLVTLERLKKPTLSALQQHLRRGEYHIFHFIGHGKYSEHKQDGMLLLEEEGGQGRPVSGQYLGTVLHDHRSLRLVVLNACEGARTSQEDPYAGVAQTLVLQGIPAVIAMQFEILETAAITFAQEFYGSVADGFPVDAAVSEARKAIFAAGNDVEWGTPVLYMRTPQGVIFEIPEAQRVKHPLSDEPVSYVDKEFEQKLEGLYTEGLAAFWVEDWDKACDRFQKILADRPDHAAAADKLAEAKRQRQLSILYTRAVEAQQAGNWSLALQTLEELQKDSPDYKDTSTTLKIVRKEKQLANLYAEAKKLYAAQKWQAVAKVFDQIHSIDSTYPDPDNLLPTAEDELTELKRQAELKELYSRAVRAMDAGQWEEAQKLLRQVHEKESGFLETERLLRKAEAEIRKVEEQQNQRNQINTLYEQAHGLLRSKKWHKALDKIEEIRELDEHFDDPEKIAERAQLELTREEQEAERQNELAAMYAEVVRLEREEKYQAALDKWQEIKRVDPKYPDRQRIQRAARKKLAAMTKSFPVKREMKVSKPLWVALGGMVTIAMIAAAFFLTRDPDVEPTSNAILPPTSSVGITVPAPTEALMTPVEFMITSLRETCPVYPSDTNIEGFISNTNDPFTPWLGDSVHFQGTDRCVGREKLGEASLIYRYRLEFKSVAQLSSVAVTGAAFNGPDSIFRVLDEKMEVIGFVETSGGNTLQTFTVDLQEVEGSVFFVDEFDTSPTWRFRQGFVINGILTTSLQKRGFVDPTMYDDFNYPPDGLYKRTLWSPRLNVNYAAVRKKDGRLSLTVNNTNQYRLVANEYEDFFIREPFFLEAELFLDSATASDFAHLFVSIDAVHKDTGDVYGSGCGIISGNETQNIQCGDFEYRKNPEPFLLLEDTSPDWHKVRIEMYPPGTIRYFIDGNYHTEYTFSQPDQFDDLRFNVNLGMNMGGSSATGYFDNVRIGLIEEDPNLLYFDDFNGSELSEVYEPLPNNVSPTYQGVPTGLFETLGQATVLRMQSSLRSGQQRGWQISTIFDPGEAPFRLELRFNTLVQSATTSIDGFLNVMLLDGADERYDKVGFFAGGYGSDREFAGKPVDLKDNTWYRIDFTGARNQFIKATVYDDESGKELSRTNLGVNLSSFPSGIKIGLMQEMGSPDPKALYPTDVAIDWIRLTINPSP